MACKAEIDVVLECQRASVSVFVCVEAVGLAVCVCLCVCVCGVCSWVTLSA